MGFLLFRRRGSEKKWISRALGASALGLPVVVAGALALVAIEARRHAQAGVAALVAEEEARLLVLRVTAAARALRRALIALETALSSLAHLVHIIVMVIISSPGRHLVLGDGDGKESNGEEEKQPSS